MANKVTLIRGDGIGPEVVDAAVRTIEATGASIDWEPAHAGAGAIPIHGAPLPEPTLESIRRNRVALKGPLATPIGGGYRSVNVSLRLEFDLYANLRPARTFAGLPSRYEKVDLIVVR
jgi:isocitrate dehydrogenase (NAD+)